MNSWLESQNTQQVKGLCSEWRRVDVDAWSIPPFPNLGWVWDASLLHANLGTGENIPHHLTSGSSSVMWGFIHSSSLAVNTWYAPGTVHGWKHCDVQIRHGPSHHRASPGWREGPRHSRENGTCDRRGEGKVYCPGRGVMWQGCVWAWAQEGPWAKKQSSLMLAFLTF